MLQGWAKIHTIKKRSKGPALSCSLECIWIQLCYTLEEKPLNTCLKYFYWRVVGGEEEREDKTGKKNKDIFTEEKHSRVGYFFLWGGAVLGFQLWAPVLVGRCSTIWAPSPMIYHCGWVDQRKKSSVFSLITFLCPSLTLPEPLGLCWVLVALSVQTWRGTWASPCFGLTKSLHPSSSRKTPWILSSTLPSVIVFRNVYFVVSTRD